MIQDEIGYKIEAEKDEVKYLFDTLQDNSLGNIKKRTKQTAGFVKRVLTNYLKY